MLILSAFRYRCRSGARSKQPPRLPSFATTFDSKDVIAEDDEEDDVEVARQLAEDWWDIWGGGEEK
jgi:hypothetical protein